MSVTTQQVTPYQSFVSVEEMNLTVRKIIYTHRLKGVKKEFLLFLSRYSCKVKGVSWQKAETMAKNFGKSERTIKRLLSALHKLGVLDRVKLDKTNWLTVLKKPSDLVELPNNSENVTPISESDTPKVTPQEIDEIPCGSSDESTKNTRETKNKAKIFKTKSIKLPLLRKKKQVVVTPIINMQDRENVPSYVPTEFVDHIWHFYKDVQAVTDIWKRVYWVAKKHNLLDEHKHIKNEHMQDCIDIAIESFNLTKEKRGLNREVYDKDSQKFYKVFFGTVKNKLSALLTEGERLVHDMVSLMESLQQRNTGYFRPNNEPVTREELDELQVY